MADPLDELAARLTRPLRTGADAAAHEQPWRGDPGRARAVALPTTVEEVRAIVAWGREHRVRLLPQGAVTGLVGASTPPPDGPAPLVVSTEALTGRLEVDAASATAVASAGVRLSALNAAARPHGLELPIDLAADPALGGMVATNTGGSRVLRHGDMSRWVLGAQAVIADEAVSVIGDVRALRKDNTGPAPTRLLLGSAGTLGIITTVAVALSPLPRERATAFVGPIADRAATDLLAHLRRGLGDHLTAFEVMCPAALRAALDHMADPPTLATGTDPEVTVLVEASGDRGTDAALVEAVAAAGAQLAGSAVLLPPARAWAVRHSITDGLRRQGTVVGFDLCVRPTDLPALRGAVREMVATRWPALAVADFGHWGDGGVHCNVVVPAGVQPDDVPVVELRRAVYGLTIDAFGGSFSAEHGIGPANAEWWQRSTPAAERAALRALRTSVDPLGLLGHPGLPF